jgi:hypothetical protein
VLGAKEELDLKHFAGREQKSASEPIAMPITITLTGEPRAWALRRDLMHIV